jgi:ankyrin repeat protein
MAQFLIEQMKAYYISIDYCSGGGKTALWRGTYHLGPKGVATMNGYLHRLNEQMRQDTIKVFLEGGADPNWQNPKTRLTCLHGACYYPQDIQSVQALLDKGAEQLVFDCVGMTPLDVAALRRPDKESGAVVDLLFANSLKFICEAEQQLDAEARVKVWLSSYSPRDLGLLRVFYWAAYFNKTTLVKKLIAYGLSPFLANGIRKYVMESNNPTRNAMVAAISSGSLDMVKLIVSLKYVAIDSSSDLDILRNGESSPVDQRVGLAKADEDANTALHIAAISVGSIQSCVEPARYLRVPKHLVRSRAESQPPRRHSYRTEQQHVIIR